MRSKGLRSCIAACEDENPRAVRRRRCTLARASPLRCMARGSRVPVIAAVERVGLCPWQRTLRTASTGRRQGGVVQVEVLFERVAGLDIGKASLTVCLRTPGPGGRRVSEVLPVAVTAGDTPRVAR